MAAANYVEASTPQAGVTATTTGVPASRQSCMAINTVGRARAPRGMPLGVVRGALVMPTVAAGKVVAEAVVDDVALVEPCAIIERALVTPLGAGRLPGAIRGRRDGGGAVGGATRMPPVTTMGSRAASQAAPAAATMVAPQVHTAEMVMAPGEGAVRGANGDDGANRCDQSSHSRRG